jgi:hypothetical protein
MNVNQLPNEMSRTPFDVAPAFAYQKAQRMLRIQLRLRALRGAQGLAKGMPALRLPLPFAVRPPVTS